MITEINGEDRLVQTLFADHLAGFGWESVYAFNEEVFGPEGTLGRRSEREVVLVRDLEAALFRLNPETAPEVVGQAVEKLTRIDPARSLLQHNREFYDYVRNGVPVQTVDEHGHLQRRRLRVVNFEGLEGNRFLAVRELKIQGVRVPHYNRRADLVCFVNGLPLVFIELKAVYRNVRLGFDENLTDYLDESSIAHAFHHNAFLVVSNGDEARYGSITSRWEHFVEWKRNDEKERGRVGGQMLLEGMLAPDKLLDIVESFLLFDDSRAGGPRKIVARNHQVLGVNNAVASVRRQEDLKKAYPVDRRTIAYTVPLPERLRVAERMAAWIPDAGKAVSRCWSASTRSRAHGCSSASRRAGGREPRACARRWQASKCVVRQRATPTTGSRRRSTRSSDKLPGWRRPASRS